MEAIRFLRGVFVSGQPFAAGQTVQIGDGIDADAALASVVAGRAVPATLPTKPAPRKRAKPIDTLTTDSEPTP